MKKVITAILVTVLFLAVLFVPIPGGTYEDGGTTEYKALTYKVVQWKRLTADGVYEKNCTYWFPKNFKSIDALWEKELATVTRSFLAKVLELTENTALVEPVEGEAVRASSDRISVNTEALPNNGIEVGSYVMVFYTGGIMETYPAKVNVVTWEATQDLRKLNYTGTWMPGDAELTSGEFSNDMVITAIYKDCFFAESVIPLPCGQAKFNGYVGDKWCVGDQVLVHYKDYRYVAGKLEADFLKVETSTFEIDPNACYKPVIYLYPEKKTEVSVALSLQGNLTCTYPSYGNGWKVTAYPDGTLRDTHGQTYSYLYWEGETTAQWDMAKGFCVKGEDTAAFLEDALEKLGLTRREANEFIVYWLPQMERNPYNIISFQTEVYEETAKLNIKPAPDVLLRVFMTWKSADSFAEIPQQELTAPERAGFTVVEWGGTEIK